MSRSTDCSSGFRLPFVFSSKTESKSMISFACGKLTGTGDCWGSSCSPISINDELPREITKDEKVTGMPEVWEGFDADVEGEGARSWANDVPEEADEGRSVPLPPRRSRTTKPSSFSATTSRFSAQNPGGVPYHRH